MTERGVGLPATLRHKPYGTVIAAGPALWVLNASFVDVDSAKLGAAASAGAAATVNGRDCESQLKRNAGEFIYGAPE